MQKPTRIILSENLRALKEAQQPKPYSQAEIARRSGVDQRYIGHILDADVSASVDIIDKLAGVFGLRAWQMLIPGLDPHNPVATVLTADQMNHYARMREAVLLLMQDPATYKPQ
jgi:transcriptional regulator with XRE-family HTH domain